MTTQHKVLTARRKEQIRINAAAYRVKQRALGLEQYAFWLTFPQSVAVREWVNNSGDISIFKGRVAVREVSGISEGSE
jgi:hypothetical protein